jgi:hypothetical protein
MGRAYAFLAVLAAGLLSAGCYMSETMLLNPAQAISPLALGAQSATTQDKAEPVTVSLEGDGWYALAGDDPEGKITRLMFTPLTTIGERTLLAYVSREEFGYIYGVAERREGRILLDLPTCEPGTGREVALAHNALPPETETVGTVCEFNRGEDIRGALIDYASRADIERDYMILVAAPE